MKKGFTLIELLVVVLIIGILSAIALPQYTKAVHKSRMAEGYSIVRTMWNACEILALESGKDLSTYGCHLNFNETSLDIPGTPTDSSSQRETQNFIYVADGDHPFPYAWYKRTKNQHALCLYVDYASKQLRCGYKSGDTEAQSLCKASNLPSASEPASPCEWAD